MEPQRDDLTPKEEADVVAALLEELGIPRDAIEEYKAHLREQGPNVTFEWHRDGANDE